MGNFLNVLNNCAMIGTQRRLWLKLYNRSPTNTTVSFFNKLENQYSGKTFWETAKALLIQKRPELISVEPEPIKDWDYFYKLNNYKWGDTCYDYDLYQSKQLTD